MKSVPSFSASALQPFLTELLAEQNRLDTPVARFSSAHDAANGTAFEIQPSALDFGGPQLIPLTAPRPGEQYAFEVDLDACTGCKSCVAACHALNGLDDEETWRDVGVVVSPERHHPFTQTITSACHHCEDPGCLNGCPVLAYEKDPITGIVRHLDDQCIGCSYCVLKCPYDVPKYSPRLGIVRKCDMCHGRLAHGEAPACAQACPTQAIKITLVASRTPEASRPSLAAESPLPAPAAEPVLATHAAILGDASYTRPTTRYLSRRQLPANLIAGDHATARPQPPHWPLAALLTLMGLAIGCSAFAALFDHVTYYVTFPSVVVEQNVTYYVTLLGWVAGVAGLTASVLHLGQPTRAWRIFLGLRTSWLSREAMVFGVWFAFATACSVERLGWITLGGSIRSGLEIATALTGCAGFFCSVMIYVDTHRQFWRLAHTAPRFFGGAAVLALASALAVHPTPALGGLLVAATLAKLLIEGQALAPLNGNRDTLTPALKSARLLVGPLRSTNELRVALALLGGLLLPLLLATDHAPAWFGWPALAASLAGELLERSLYFRAVDAPKMPGVPA